MESAGEALTGGEGPTISEQCRILDVSRSGYYRWLKRKDRGLTESDSRKEMKALADAVLDAYSRHPSFGYRKMAAHLARNGFENATEKRIRLLYRQLGLRGARQTFRTTRPAKGRVKKYPCLLKDKPIMFVNQAWATDITYIKLPDRMVFLTAIIDLYSRKILSWRLSGNMKVDFCLDALNEAVVKYGIPAIFNTDCGSQYTSEEFVRTLEALGIEISMNGVGRCLDNIRVERTWKTVKYEFIFLHEWHSEMQLEKGLEEFINDFNSQRPHEALGYQTPDEVYEKGCFPVRENNTVEVA